MSKSVKKSAILAEGVLDRKEGDHLAELSELAYIAGYNIVGKITQNIDRPTPDYFFGEGKAKEIKAIIKEKLADVIIIENNLDSYQYENLRRLWQVDIIDRFELILEIFINKAGTQEAITQIRLATLKKEGGSRLESHRTSVARDALIKKLEKKLDLIKKAKDLRRQRRIKLGFDLVAIAGYTNSGKSTLMNTLTSANVEVSPKMFTTLDTKTSSFDAYGRKILITDTVGFISRLPNILIDAFYATLKEINEADLIILLIDGNDSVENIKRKTLACMNTLSAIKANIIPLIPVLNKIDIAQNLDEKEKVINVLLGKSPIKISAKNQMNIEFLLNEVLTILQTYTFHLIIPNNSEGMSFISKIHDKTRIKEEKFHADNIELIFETNKRLGEYLYNLILKSRLEIKILNKNAIESQLKEKSLQMTQLQTELGEEFIVYDLKEEIGKMKKISSTDIESLSYLTEIEKETKKRDNENVED